jgi:hypothetical protein
MQMCDCLVLFSTALLLTLITIICRFMCRSAAIYFNA